MTDLPEILRRNDGSIDTAYYVEKGLSRRSEAAQEIADQTARRMRGVLVGLKVFGRHRTALQNPGLLSRPEHHIDDASRSTTWLGDHQTHFKSR